MILSLYVQHLISMKKKIDIHKKKPNIDWEFLTGVPNMQMMINHLNVILYVDERAVAVCI